MANNPLNASKILFDEQDNNKSFAGFIKHLQDFDTKVKQVFKSASESSIQSLESLDKKLKSISSVFETTSNAALDMAKNLKTLAGQPDAFSETEKKLSELVLQMQALKKIEKETNTEREAAKKTQKEVNALNKEYTKSLKALEKENAKVSKQLTAMTKKYNVQTKAQKAADNSLEKLKLEAKQSEKVFKSLENSIDSTSDEVTEAKENFLRLKSQLNESNQELRDQVKAIDLAADSYLSWQAVVTKASKELKKLEDPLGRNKKRADELRKSINDNKDKLKEFDKSIGNFQRNVGNYESALGDLEGAFNGLPSAVSGSAGALLEFGKNLKGNKIAAATAALAGLGAAFAQTKEGGEDIQKTLAGAESAFDTLVGTLGGAVVNLGTFFSNLDTDKGDQAFVRLSQTFDGLGDKIDDNFEKGKSLEGTFIGLEKKARFVEVQISKLNVAYELQNAIADDATKSFKEREEASLKALDISEEIADKGIKLAQQELGIINKRLKLKQQSGVKDKELLDQQLEANKKLIEAEGEFTLRLRENEKQRTELKQDRLEKDLDILIDGFDNQKTINERIINSDKTVFDNRQELLDETEKLADASFKAQKGIIDELSAAGVNVDDLLKLDATELQKRIRSLEQSEIIEGRTLEVVRERRIVLQDLKEAQDDLNEAAFERLAIENNIALKTALLTSLTLKEREELIEKFNSDVEDAEIERLENEIAARKKRNEDTLQLESDLADALFAQKEGQIEEESELAEKAKLDKKESIDDEITLINLGEQRAKNINSFLQKNIKDENTLRLLKLAGFLIEQRAAKLRERAKSGGVGVASSPNVFGFLSSLPSFATGVIGFKGEGTETSDSNVVRIANNESVMTGKATRNSKGLLTEIQAGRITDMNLPSLEAKQPNMIQLERKLVVQNQRPEIDYKKLASEIGVEVAKNMPKVDIIGRSGYIGISVKNGNHITEHLISERSLKYEI